MGRFLGCRRRASELLGGHEVLLSAFYRKQIGNDLPCHREGGAVAIASLHLFFVDQSQLVALSGSELRCLDQHMLNVFVANKSGVNVSNRRTESMSRSGGTETNISSAPISIPAASGCMIGSIRPLCLGLALLLIVGSFCWNLRPEVTSRTNS